MSKMTATVTPPNYGETVWAVDVYKDSVLFYTVYYGSQSAAESYAESFNRTN